MLAPVEQAVHSIAFSPKCRLPVPFRRSQCLQSINCQSAISLQRQTKLCYTHCALATDVSNFVQAPHQPAASAVPAVATCFRWPGALNSQAVSVLGSFNAWQEPVELHKAPDGKDWSVTLAVSPGLQQYKFLVDKAWRASPCEPVISDGKGSVNNQRSVNQTATFAWVGDESTQEVFVAGDFTGWADLLPLVKGSDGRSFTLGCSLPPGVYHYQFLVDGEWKTSSSQPIVPDAEGRLCNQIVVEAVPAFHIFYATGWQKPILRYRATLPNQQLPQEWQETALHDTGSRAQPSGGRWKAAVIPLPSSIGPYACLEFVLKNSAGQVDKPVGAEAYTCPYVGGYKLQGGQLQPFPQATAGPIMLVSDLDGTMVGNGEEADAMTQAFTDYWENNAVMRHSILVYNTGRSLGQITSLFQEKAGALALPNVLISAVGTKIFLMDMDAGDRHVASGQKWHEDLQWAKRLEQGWNLSAVKQVADVMVQQHSSEVHWLDHGTEHPHRIALSVHTNRLQDCISHLQRGFEQHNVQVRIIVSGVGDYRYVDCVAINAGKQEALEYIRTLYDIPLSHCMAAGDSGNDTLMLEGKHKAIVVGNAQPELLQWLLKQQQTGRIVYTDAHMAHGILEGITRHGLY